MASRPAKNFGGTRSTGPIFHGGRVPHKCRISHFGKFIVEYDNGGEHKGLAAMLWEGRTVAEITREELLDRYPRLSGMDLTALDLSNLRLDNINLSHADLSYCNLQGTDLSEANLVGANLEESFLQNTNLLGANLSTARLRRARLDEADLTVARLTRADCSEAHLYKALLSGADLRGAILYRADLSGADLCGTDFRNADLRQANLQGAKVRGGEGMYGNPDLLVYLTEANFENARLDGAKLGDLKITTTIIIPRK
jgi:uncharacterized protein YjbI with pentapeptide repeats